MRRFRPPASEPDPLINTITLGSGDTLATGPTGRAALLFANGTEAHLSANSSLLTANQEVSTMKQTGIRWAKGLVLLATVTLVLLQPPTAAQAFDSFDAKQIALISGAGGVVGSRFGPIAALAGAALGALAAAKGAIHGDITREALKDEGVKGDYIAAIVSANWHQDYDQVKFIVGAPWLKPNDRYSPDHHFDRLKDKSHGEAFRRGAQYVRDQRGFAITKVGTNHMDLATQAIGRSMHALQDFFSHSNFVELSKEEQEATLDALFRRHPEGRDPPAALKITGTQDGKDLPNDGYGHNAHAKDNPGKNDDARRDFQKARDAAIDACRDLIRGIKNDLGENAKRLQ
jgi:hypothetical protein